MSQNSLNDIAMERFNLLKSKMKLDGINNINNFKEEIKTQLKITDKEFERLQDAPIMKLIDAETENNVKLVDNIFEFIEALKLPPKLSLAVGLIISAGKADKGLKTEELERAIESIRGEINA